MSEAQNNKDVYKIYNNAHYQLLEKKGSIIKFVGFRVSDILPSAFIHYL